MRLTHIALWTNRPEELRDFYIKYFNGKSNKKYINPQKGFSSYFVYFEEGAALEIMRREDITEHYEHEHIGLAHLAFHARSKSEVNMMIERLRADGYTIAGETRVSGDGYYEGVALDPDGNIVEIVAEGDPEIERALFPPYELLLEADPDREKIDGYLKDSDCMIATLRGSTAGVIVVRKEDDGLAEIMNLSVGEIYKRRGIGRALIRYVIERWAVANMVKRIRVCTGSSSIAPLALYQNEGFRIVDIDYAYFIREYSEPIWENGIQCRDRVVLERDI